MRGDKRNAVRSRPSQRCNRGIRYKPYRRTLGVERLEERQLLATLAMDFRFLRDDVAPDGSFAPGDVIGEVQDGTLVVPVGDEASFFPFSFWVEVQVEDRRTNAEQSAGIIALPLNVSWNLGNSETPADAVMYSGVVPEPGLNPNSYDVQQNNRLVTPNFPLQRFVDDRGDTGQFRNLRGAAMPAANLPENFGQEIGKGQLEAFSQMRFTADEMGKACFSAELAGSMSFADAAMLDSVIPASACIEFLSETRTSSLSGFVYVDANENGRRDMDGNGAPLEQGLPGVEIALYRDGTFVASDRTGPDGWYRFDDLTAGTYEIRQASQPVCFRSVSQTLGTIWPSGESRGISSEDRFTGIELDFGEAGIDYDFGKGFIPKCFHKGMLLGSADLTQATVYEPLGIPSAKIDGTDGPDTFRVKIDTAAIVVTVNDGPPQAFPTKGMQIVSIDAKAGQDTIIVEGSSADELAHFQPNLFTYRNAVCYPEPTPAKRCEWTWALEVTNVEAVKVDSGAGRDLAVVRDSYGNDTLRAETDRATIRLSNQDLELLAFDRLRAFSTRGGNDRAFIGPLPLPVELFGNWIR